MDPRFNNNCVIYELTVNFKWMHYSRACGSDHDFLEKGLLLTMKLLNQAFLVVRVTSLLWKAYGRVTMTWQTVTAYLFSKRQQTCSIYRNHNAVHLLFITYHRACNKSNDSCHYWNINCLLFRSTPVLLWGSCCSICSFLCIDLQIIVGVFSFFLSLYCLSSDGISNFLLN